MPNQTEIGTPAKLGNGEWGAKTVGVQAWPGRTAQIEVTTRSGKSWTATYHCVEASKSKIHGPGQGVDGALWERV